MIRSGTGSIPEDLKHIPTLSPSRLLDFMESPRYYNWVHNLGNKPKASKAMEDSRMVHKYILEPESFNELYVDYFGDVEPLETVDQIKAYLDAAGHSYKKTAKKAELVNEVLSFNPQAPIYDHVLNILKDEGKILIDSNQLKMLADLKDLFFENSFIKSALSGGEAEQLLWVYDETAGVIWRFKPDYIKQINNKLVVTDIKKIPSTKKQYFDRWLYTSQAYVQMAIYRECLRMIKNSDPMVMIAAYEIDEPYAVEVYHIDEGALSAGWIVARKKAIEFVECVTNNYWPTEGRGRIQSGQLPAWALNQINYEMEMES